MSKYKIGDTAWLARCDYMPISRVCDTCYGKRKVTLILGNGDTVELPCNACDVGCSGPTGIIQGYNYVVAPRLVHITGIAIDTDCQGEKVEYREGSGCSYFTYQEDQLFDTEEEAAEKGQQLKKELEKDQNTRSEHIKKDKRKSLSWNAAYHLRTAKKMREDAEYHDKMAIVCKARSKDDHAVPSNTHHEDVLPPNGVGEEEVKLS
jgi:hypothetical protein